MPTLQEITLAHSQRLSEIYRARDMRIAQAQSLRDAQLRGVPGAAKVYDKYDDELSAAREKHLATENKAEAARNATLLAVSDHRSDVLEDAQMARRSADIDVVAAKRRADDAANRKYDAAIASLREMPFSNRDKAAHEAERARRTELDAARRMHDDGLAASQKSYREVVDEALVTERRESRNAERGYLEALRLGDSAMRAARSVADQSLAAALIKVPEAAEVVRSWRAALATIARETNEAEQDAFARFRRDLESIKA